MKNSIRTRIPIARTIAVDCPAAWPETAETVEVVYNSATNVAATSNGYRVPGNTVAFWKSVRFLGVLCLTLWLTAPSMVADEPHFFRIVGPAAAAITSCTLDGCITWTNAQVGTNYTVQAARRLGATTDWVDYIQIPASNHVVTQRLYDPKPPSDMVLIPAGSFTMGNCMPSSEGFSFELPLHTVYVSAFYMDKYLVTKSLWDTVKAWSAGNGYGYDRAGSGKAADHPVHTINWYDALKWCNARSQREGLTPCYYLDSGLKMVYKTGYAEFVYVNWMTNGYRLPTEAEWEKAARGGVAGHRFPWTDADTITHSRANYFSTNSYDYDVSPTRGFHPTFAVAGEPYTSPVRYFAANGYGLYDMAGNVAQWCWDRVSTTYYSSSPATDPRGPAWSPGARIVRGTSFDNQPVYSRCSARLIFVTPLYAVPNIGFRCVRGL